MSEMIERVARVIWESDLSRRTGDGDFYPAWRSNSCETRPYLDAAVKAIEAMREPTKAMVQRGFDEPRGEMDWLKAIATSWRAMIDEALK